VCDTMVALPTATLDGSTILAKNSDREPNEAQALSLVPRQSYPDGATLRCTYITIPQARQTSAVLLSRPFWMWGAEMGANEHGVVIGNEAVFAKAKVPKSGLTGMDLLRLGLERGDTAEEALAVITGLLEAHGQGGSGGYQHPFFYHNSFIIADPASAWVLETVDRQWAARQVRDVASISNGMTIGADFERASPNLVGYATEHGWHRGNGDLDFAATFSDFLYTRFSACRLRQPHTVGSLRAMQGKVDVPHMMSLLRSHAPSYRPAAGSNADICMHFAGGLVRGSQTTGSLVAHLRPGARPTYWLTGTSAPCLSVFKPFYIGSSLEAQLPEALGPEPGPQYDPAALWWQAEHLHRLVLKDYPARHAAYAAERDALEAAFLAGDAQLPADGSGFSAGCVAQSREAMSAWIARVAAMPITQGLPWSYGRRWQAQSRAAGLPAS